MKEREGAIMEYFVADSYKDAKRISEPFEQNGKTYLMIKMPCPRCGGTGNYSYNQMDGTLCYGCMGAKTITKQVRAYSEKEYNQIKQAVERRKAAHEKLQAEKVKLRLNDTEKYKHTIAMKLGFDENEQIYLVYGDDTYSIKERLKELGGRFDPTYKWYFNKVVQLPEGFHLCPIAFDEIFEYNPITNSASYKMNTKQIISKKIAELTGASESVYYFKNVGEKITDPIAARVAKIRGFSGMYGYTYIYTFTSGYYIFTWITAKPIDVALGDAVLLTGTIKKFEEYEGEHITYITRCTVKKMEE